MSASAFAERAASADAALKAYPSVKPAIGASSSP
jgi:hypothetical protein